jgi:hypothetical protein
MSMTRNLLSVALISSLAALPRVALADPPPPAAPPPTDVVAPPPPASSPSPPPELVAPPPPAPELTAPLSNATNTASNLPERGLLFAVEPMLPEAGHAVVGLGMGNVTRSGEERPVGSGQVFPTLGAEVGLLSRLSLYAEGGVVLIQSGNPGQLASPLILDAGAHILLTSPTSRTWRLSLRPSYSYDVTGASTANLTATLGWYYQQVRVVSSFMGSHTFQSGADTVDLQATLGATYSLPLGFRVGVEGVVSDLEELFTPGDEGGASAFAGPTAGWEWDRVQLVAGPAFGVTPGAIYDSFLFRAALAVRL